MTKLELIEALAKKQPYLALKDVDLAVDCIIEHMCQALITNDRIELRGFGSFSLHYHPARIGRNPKTGESLTLSAKYSVHFKPGKELKHCVDESRLACQIRKGGSITGVVRTGGPVTAKTTPNRTTSF